MNAFTLVFYYLAILVKHINIKTSNIKTSFHKRNLSSFLGAVGQSRYFTWVFSPHSASRLLSRNFLSIPSFVCFSAASQSILRKPLQSPALFQSRCPFSWFTSGHIKLCSLHWLSKKHANEKQKVFQKASASEFCCDPFSLSTQPRVLMYS